MNTFLNRANIEIVFLDWFGVVSTNFYWCVQSKENKLLKNWCDSVFDNPEILNDWMRGKHDLTSLSNIKVPMDLNIIKKLFLKDISFYEPDKKFLEGISLLFPKAKKMLITDNMSLFSDIINQYKLQDFFEKIYVSSDIGLLKKDSPTSLFHHVLSDLDKENFSNCVLIDDDFENCNKFKKLGGRVIHIN